MKNLLVFSYMLASFLLFPLKSQAELLDTTFRELAQTHFQWKLPELIENLATFHEKSLPHETKVLRRSLRDFKMALDILAPLYPYSRERDLWLELKQQLDEGYEKMGEFKDLYDSQPQPANPPMYDEKDLKEIQKLRPFLLAWKNNLLKFMKKNQLVDYLSQPQMEVVICPRTDEPKFFWRRHSYRPKGIDLATDVLHQLRHELLHQLLEDYKEVIRLKRLIGKKSEKKFHDFRKQARAILKIPATFPEIFPQDYELKGAYLELSQVVFQLGVLNDKLLLYHKYRRRGSEQKLYIIRNEIQKHWDQTLASLLNRSFEDFIKDWKKNPSQYEFPTLEATL